MANIYDIELLNSILNPKIPESIVQRKGPFGGPFRPEQNNPYRSVMELMPDPNFPQFPEIDMGATGIIPQLDQGIMSQAQDFEFLPSANESDLGYFYDANRNLYDSDDQKPKGIAKLFEFLKNIPTPFNLARRGLESLRGANQRLRNTDFGQSKNLMEYLGKRQARKEAERLAPIQKQLQEASDRGGGYQATSRQQNEARTASRVGPRGNTRAYGL